MTLAAADVGLALVIAVSSVWGYQRGLVRELLSIVTLFVAAVGALIIGPEIGSFVPLFGLEEQADEELGLKLQGLIGMSIAFGTIYLAGWFALHQIERSVENSWIGVPNRTLGVFFGSLRGLAIVIVIILFADQSMREHSWWRDSLLVGFLLPFTDEVLVIWGFLVSSVTGSSELGGQP